MFGPFCSFFFDFCFSFLFRRLCFVLWLFGVGCLVGLHVCGLFVVVVVGCLGPCVLVVWQSLFGCVVMCSMFVLHFVVGRLACVGCLALSRWLFSFLFFSFLLAVRNCCLVVLAFLI